jgi:hypothetical protein
MGNIYFVGPTSDITKKNDYLMHSAKGTTWKNHKYIKKIEDRYYYTKESLSKALNKAGSSIKETKSDLKTRKELGKANKATYDEAFGIKKYVDGVWEPEATTHGSISYSYDKYGNYLGDNYDNKKYWELHETAQKAADKYSKTKLSSVEANSKVVSTILNIVYGTSEENYLIKNFGKHHPNGQEEHV